MCLFTPVRWGELEAETLQRHAAQTKADGRVTQARFGIAYMIHIQFIDK